MTSITPPIGFNERPATKPPQLVTTTTVSDTCSPEVRATAIELAKKFKSVTGDTSPVTRSDVDKQVLLLQGSGAPIEGLTQLTKDVFEKRA